MSEFQSLLEVAAQHEYWPEEYAGSALILCSCGAQMTASSNTRANEYPAHLADAWREACTVRTVEQLDALPVGSVVMPLWADAGPCWKLSDGWHKVIGDGTVHPLGTARKGETALLIHHPDWERP